MFAQIDLRSIDRSKLSQDDVVLLDQLQAEMEELSLKESALRAEIKHCRAMLVDQTAYNLELEDEITNLALAQGVHANILEEVFA